MKRLRAPLAIALATACALSGCSTLAERHFSTTKQDIASADESSPGYIPRKLVEEGAKYLENRDLENAGRLFNAAVKFAPDRFEVHLLSGLVYHLEFLRGTPQSKDLAEVAYQIASRQMPTSHLPLVMLGWLHLDSGQNNVAYDEFARALELRPTHPDVMLGMMQASYLTGDMKTALWMSDQLEKHPEHATEITRLKAVLLMAAGQPDKSRAYAARYLDNQALAQNVRARFTRRLDELDSLIRDAMALDEGRRRSGISSTANDAPSPAIQPPSRLTTAAPLVLAQMPGTLPGVIGTPYTAQGQANVPGNPQAMPYGAQPVYPGPGYPGAPNTAQGVMPYQNAGPSLPPPRRKWHECSDSNAAMAVYGGGGAYGGGYGGGGAYGGSATAGQPSSGGSASGGSGGDETSTLSALPAPCSGDPTPRMAVIDAVLVRTEEVINRSYGVNLLQNLTAFFSYSRTYTSTASTTGGTAGDTAVVSRAWGLSQPGSFLGYALNIANSANSRNEVIARPSLLAIDRFPSTFFSGSSITLGIAGSAGSASTITDRQVGISLSVTPTFVDDDTVMLAVKATRSFVQPGVSVGSSFGQQLNTSRNAVTANVSVKFGETLILSGLTEREVQRGDSGVPVLKNVPGLQYLFDSVANSDFNRTVLMMITPRKPIVNETDLEKARRDVTDKGVSRSKRYAFHWRIKEYEEVLARYAPNLDTVMLSLDNNQLYRNFSSRDLVDDTWAAQEPIKKFIRDLKEMLYR